MWQSLWFWLYVCILLSKGIVAVYFINSERVYQFYHDLASIGDWRFIFWSVSRYSVISFKRSRYLKYYSALSHFCRWLRDAEKLSDFPGVSLWQSWVSIRSFHFSFAAVKFAFKYCYLFILTAFIYELLAGKIILGWILTVLNCSVTTESQHRNDLAALPMLICKEREYHCGKCLQR